MEILLVAKRAVHLSGNGPRLTPSVLRLCVLKADRTSEHSHGHRPLHLAITASRREFVHAPTRLRVLMFDAAVTWKAEFRMYFPAW